MLHQHTILYFQTYLLTGSVACQCCFVCTFLPFPVSCSRQHQNLLIYYIGRKFPTVCMGALTLIGIIAMQNNYIKGLCQLRIVWSYLRQYQRGVMWPMFMISLSYLLVYYQEYFQCDQPWITLIYLHRISRWSSQHMCGT